MGIVALVGCGRWRNGGLSRFSFHMTEYPEDCDDDDDRDDDDDVDDPGHLLLLYDATNLPLTVPPSHELRSTHV